MEFTMFSLEHAAALFAGLVVLAAVCLQRGKIRSADRKIGLIGACMLIGSELALQGWYIARGVWGADSLPLQLCSMTLLASAAALLMPGSRVLQDIVFFLGTLGAMQALITPNLDFGFPHFRYFHFFLAHIGILATAVYLFAVRRYRPRLRSAVSAFCWLQGVALIAAAANGAFGTNFMFLARKPSTASLLDALSPWPRYIPELEAVAAILILMLYGLARGVETGAGRFRRRKSGRQSAAAESNRL
ncbi:TIGR02206 family membrane protein [Paenibacillus thailandensis]|uniref:TIGR02206 family membrane protein n=1 Tax=Paenibacillus thailandensis TaxID=393250 RepID=A0ABW5QXT8_9BACL